jgi:PKD domain
MKPIGNSAMKAFIHVVYISLIVSLAACDTGIPEPDAGPLPAGSFISQVDIKDPFKISFSAAAQNATDIFWDFGDGLGVSKGATVSYTYSLSGTYTVTLTLINKAGVQDVKQELVISGPETPITSFNYIIDDVNAPLTVVFDNTSQYGATFNWEFGDGNTSTEKNPTHTYLSTGKYSVRLTVTGVDGVKKSSLRREFFVINVADLTDTENKTWGFAITLPSGVPSAYYVTNAEGQVVISSTLQDCELNDRYVFSASGTYQCENQGDARLKSTNYECAPLVAPISQNWSFIRNTNLSFSLTVGLSYIGDPAGSASYRIISISPSRMQLDFDRDAGGGSVETVHLTLEPK